MESLDMSRRQAWDSHFLLLALSVARNSNDPNTKVGAVIVDPTRYMVRTVGFNRFPNGVAETPERMGDRDTKLELIVHAECDALMQAARIGKSVRGCTMYVACTDDSGAVWGGPPCIRCAVHVIQAGIKEVVAYPKKLPSKWAENLAKSELLLAEARVGFMEWFDTP